MSTALKFDPKLVDKIEPIDARVEYRDAVVEGLRLIVQAKPSGRKSWAFRFRHGGKQYKATLGAWPALQVAPARVHARAMIEQLTEGKNPLRVPEPTVGPDGLVQTDTSVEAIVALYDRTHVATLRKGTQKYVMRELNAAAAAWPGHDIASIKKNDVLALTDAAQKRGQHAKNQTLKTLQAFFKWCEMDRGLIEYNPARGIRKVKVEARDRVLLDGEIKMLWAAATKANGPYGALTKLLLLTGCRRNEIAHLEWSEITDDAIRLPAERTKSNEAHVVPLTSVMKAIIDALPRRGKYALGNGRKPMSASAWAKAQIDVSLNREWRFHDLRRTFRSGLSRLGVRREIAEACLNHAAPSIVGVYDLHDFEAEKLAAFTKWSDHVAALTADQAVAA